MLRLVIWVFPTIAKIVGKTIYAVCDGIYVLIVGYRIRTLAGMITEKIWS
jgi:hypothetical protein